MKPYKLTPVAAQKIVGYFHRVACPVYMGILALDTGYNLDQMETMLQALQDVGVLRPLTDDEKRARKIDVRGNVWVLIETPHPSKARW